MNRRNMLKTMGKSVAIPLVGNFPNFYVSKPRLRLSEVRAQINRHFESLLPKEVPYGAYRTGFSEATDLYASCDVAIARHIMGEKLAQSLNTRQREAWISYINTFQQPEDGSYTERFNHSKLHANGMAIGALGVLGGRQKYPVKLYEDFNTVEKVVPWLEQINWEKQWSASHLFWGGIHCYSLSKACSPAWLKTVFLWLNENLDEQTGWWRKSTTYTDRHQPLGGSVHILPIYQHHGRHFPYPKRVIDSVLALQLPNGRWLERAKDQQHVMHYLELDALYALQYMGTLAPDYKKEAVTKAVNKYADLVQSYWNDPQAGWQEQHPHRILSMVGTFGLLQKLLPDRFSDDVSWTDIFSDIQLYNTAAVEVIELNTISK